MGKGKKIIITPLIYLNLFISTLLPLKAQWNVSPGCWAFGGSNSDYGESAVELGNMLLVGSTVTSFGIGNEDAYIIALDNFGVPVWARAIGTSDDEWAFTDGIAIGDTMAIFVGTTDNTPDDAGVIFAIKSDGTVLWRRAINFTDADCGLTGIDYLPGDTTVWVVGSCSDLPTEDAIMVAQFSVTGNLLKSFGLHNLNYDISGEDIEISQNGELFISGLAEINNDDILFARVDTAGNVLSSVIVGGNKRDLPGDIVLFPDDANPNSVYIVGATESYGAGARDGYIVRLDLAGNLIWGKTYGNLNRDELQSIDRAPFNQLIVAGRIRGVGVGADDMFVLLIDSTGDTIWTAIIGGLNDDEANYVKTTGDGGFAVVGSTTSFGFGGSEIYVTKITNSGVVASDSCCLNIRRGTEINTGGIVSPFSLNVFFDGVIIPFASYIPVDSSTKCGSASPPSWNVPTGCWTIGGPLTDIGYSAEITSQGNFFVAGATSSYGNGQLDQYLVTIDASGTIVWTATAGGSLNDVAYASAIIGQDTIVAGGYTTSAGAGGEDIYITVWDGGGSLLKNYVLGGTGNESILEMVGETPKVYFTGYTTSFGAGQEDILFGYVDVISDQFKLLSIGTSEKEVGLSIASDVLSNNFYVAGYRVRTTTGSDFLLIKVDETGTIEWARTWGTSNDDTIFNVIVKPNGDVLLIGSSINPASGNNSIYIAVFDPLGVLIQEAFIDKGSNIYDPVGDIASWDVGVITAAVVQNNPGVFDMTKVNGDLKDTVWNRTYGDTTLVATLHDVIETGDLGLVFVGSLPTPSEDIYLLKVNAYGDITSTLQCCSQYPSSGIIDTPLTSEFSFSPSIDSGGTLASLSNTSSGGGWICGNPLYFVLEYFYATLLSNTSIEISWGVSTEKNVDHYVVEMYEHTSNDWMPIYQVSASGKVTPTSYTLTLSPNSQGILQFRLRVIFTSGDELISSIQTVALYDQSLVNVFYDPENNTAFVTLPSNFKGFITFSTIDGKTLDIIETYNYKPEPQTIKIPINLPSLSVVTILSADEKKSYSRIINH